MEATFLSFAAHGARRPSRDPGAGAAAPRGIDGPRFAKLCREAGVVGGCVTATDVDLEFSKAGQGGVGAGRRRKGARAKIRHTSHSVPAPPRAPR